MTGNKALVIGINNYSASPLRGCENDASRIGELLSRNEDGSTNFDCLTILSTKWPVKEALLKQKLEDLYSGNEDLNVFYFSGHGYFDGKQSWIIPCDATKAEESISMKWLMKMINKSKVKRTVLILDCCHAGGAGNHFSGRDWDLAELREGVTILAAARPEQFSMEKMGSGIFTSILTLGLEGAAADILGNVSAAGLYARSDALLGAWQQRPVFKTHEMESAILRRCQPVVTTDDLKKMPEVFIATDFEFRLEPEKMIHISSAGLKFTAEYEWLTRLEKAGLIVNASPGPVTGIELPGVVRLSVSGKFYWQMIRNKQI